MSLPSPSSGWVPDGEEGARLDERGTADREPCEECDGDLIVRVRDGRTTQTMPCKCVLGGAW